METKALFFLINTIKQSVLSLFLKREINAKRQIIYVVLPSNNISESSRISLAALSTVGMETPTTLTLCLEVGFLLFLCLVR